MSRWSLVFLVTTLLVGGCARRDRDAEKREGARQQKRQRRDHEARERAAEAERHRMEELRRELARKQEDLRRRMVTPSADTPPVGSTPAAAEVARLRKKLAQLRQQAAARAKAERSARRTQARPRAPAPVPRRRLKRPRRRRSPSLEGLFE